MDFRPTEAPLLRLMSMIARKHRANAHAMMKDQEVSHGQPPVLFELTRNDGLRQSELANRLRIKPATLTAMINRMVKNGHVERRTEPQDQRVSRVYLTDQGRAAVNDVRAAMQLSEQIVLDGLTPEEKMLLRRLLLQMFDNVSRHDDLVSQQTKGALPNDESKVE